jgi:hypothetical protein
MADEDVEEDFFVFSWQLYLGWGHIKETGNHNITTALKKFCQTELNMWNWIEQRNWRNSSVIAVPLVEK